MAIRSSDTTTAAPNAASSTHPIYADRSGFAYSDDPEFGIGTAQDQTQLRARFVPLLSTSGLLAAPAAAAPTGTAAPTAGPASGAAQAGMPHHNVPVAQSLLSSVPSSPLATTSGAIPVAPGGAAGVVVAPTAALRAWAAAGGVVSATATGGPAEGPGSTARKALVATLERMAREDAAIDSLVNAAFTPAP